jgi:hypothetical protein
MNINNIIEGWKNVVLNDKLIEKLFIERATICGECPFLVLKKVCGKCGCPIIAKLKATKEMCPLSKWYPVTLHNSNGERWLSKRDGSIIK